jgi:hypothetical protein
LPDSIDIHVAAARTCVLVLRGFSERQYRGRAGINAAQQVAPFVARLASEDPGEDLLMPCPLVRVVLIGWIYVVS